LYLYLLKKDLYNLLFLGKGADRQADRKEIKDFFLNKGKNKINIQLRGLTDNDIPIIKIGDKEIDLKFIELDRFDFAEWSAQNLDKIFYNSIRLKIRIVKDLQTPNLLTSLKEPITNFGLSLKQIALKYGNNPDDVPRKIYIIPLVSYSHGLGQKMSSQDSYTQLATDKVQIEGKDWNCWILDGTKNGANLYNFNEKYKAVLRALLEGKLTLIIYAVDDKGDYIPIGAINMIQGAIRLEELYFTKNTKNYRTFTKIETFDIEFYNEKNQYNIVSVMIEFDRNPLPFVPISQKVDWSMWEQHAYIRDFF